MAINTDSSHVVEVQGTGPSSAMATISIQRLHDRLDADAAITTLWKAGKKSRDGRKSVVKSDSGETLSIDIEDLPISQQLAELAYGETLSKPYDQTVLSQYIEYSQMLKTCIEVAAANSTLLGLDITPRYYPHRKVADLKGDEKTMYDEQKLSLLHWVSERMEGETTPEEMSYRLAMAVVGLGEGYIEVVRDALGKAHAFLYANPMRIWVGRMKDRFVQISYGRKAYFKPYRNPFSPEPFVPRRADNFLTAEESGDADKGGIPIAEQATELIHFRQFSLLNDTYGVPSWTPSIPAILGSRAAEERNETFFQNDAVPRMAILVSGGALTEATVTRLQSFFKKGHKGVVNSNRVLILEVSAQNTNQPDWKPPVIQMKPLTVGKIDDASFLSYLEANKNQIRESFRIAGIFLGSGGDVNRAAAYTLREMTVNLVFKILGQQISSVFNKTLLYEWAYDAGISPENIKVQFGFILPKTMSQADEASIKQKYATAGALTPNDLREDLGLERIDEEWANIPSALTIVFAQMGLMGGTAEAVMDATDSKADTTEEKAKAVLQNLRKALAPFVLESERSRERLDAALKAYQDSLAATVDTEDDSEDDA